MTNNGIVVLSQSDLRAVMSFGDYVEAVADGFRQLAEGGSEAPVPLHMSTGHGTFHVKGATLARGSGYVAVKINGNFPDNRTRNGLPTIQGAVFLADASNGRPLALLDSMEITLQRTGAATAVAARHLARPDSRTATICGCGTQGSIQMIALRHALDLRRVWHRNPLHPGVVTGHSGKPSMPARCAIMARSRQPPGLRSTHRQEPPRGGPQSQQDQYQ